MENDLSQSAMLTKFVGWYEDFENNTTESRYDSELNRDYYDNKQYTQEEIDTLERRKQPVITYNLTKRTIDALLGFEQSNRTDPKVLPRTPKHEDDAEGCTDAIRYVLDNNDFDEIASNGFFHLLVEGSEGAEVIVKRNKRGGFEVKIIGFPWDRMWWDIHSRAKDYSDCKYKGVVIWMDYDDARDRWPGADLEMAIGSTDNYSNETHDDKPIKWNDTTRKRLRVAMVNYKENGQWHHATFTKAGILEQGISPYLDEDDEPDDTLVFQSAFVDRDGVRYAYTTALRSPQDEVNKRRSKALHLMNQRQTFANQTTGIDTDKIKRELAKPDGHVDMRHGTWMQDFGIIPTVDMATGNIQLFQEAKEMFNVVGANTSITGKEDRVRSGRAEIVRQQAGARELTPVLSAHRSFKRRIYRKIWNRIRQFWTEERWVRVTDDEENLKWVGLNQPVTLGEQLQQEYQDDPERLALLQQNANDPRLQQVVGRRNAVAELDVDILIDEAPDIATIQQEQFQMVADMYNSNPREVPFEAVVELSSLRNKAAFLEKIKGGREQQQAAAQAQQEAQEIQKAGAIAEIEKTHSETQENLSQAEQNRAQAFKYVSESML